MNFTVFSPNDTPVQKSQSDITDARFGGQRQALNQSIGDAKDYTKRTGEAPTIKENPVDTAVRDIDEMANTSEHKNRFTQEEIRADVQKGNESVALQSDSDNRPRMDEGTDGVQVPISDYREEMKKKNRWSFNSTEIYEGEIS
jgi:hypothetical protein